MAKTKKTKRSSSKHVATEKTAPLSNDNTIMEEKVERNGNRSIFSLIFLAGILVLGFSIIYQYSLKKRKNIFSYEISDRDEHNTTAKEKADLFIDWFKAMGGSISPHVTLGVFSEYGGYGLVATNHQNVIKENTTFTCESGPGDQCSENVKVSYNKSLNGVQYMQEMFTVPQSIIISIDRIFSKYKSMSHSSLTKEDVEQALSYRFEGDNMVSQDIIIALELMVQCSLGKKSKHYPYLQVLPNYVPRLDTFSKQELATLQDKQLEDLGIQSRNNLQNVWENDGLGAIAQQMLHDTLLAMNPGNTVNEKDSISVSLEEKKCMSFSSFHKYVAIVSSRAMVLHGTKFLTPLADMLNHSPSNRHEYDGKTVKTTSAVSRIQYFTKYHQRREDGSIIVRSDRHTPPGEQIMEDYGELDNSLFLEAHGFVPFQNPSHCAMLSTNHIPSFSSFPIEMRNVMIHLRLITKPPENNNDETVNGQDKNVSPSPPPICVRADGTVTDRRSEAFVSALGLLEVLPQDDTTILLRQRCYEADKSGDFELVLMRCVYYHGHRQRTMQLLQKISEQTIKNAMTSVQNDLELLKGLDTKGYSGSTLANLIALKFRIEEKKVLEQITTIRSTCSNCTDATHQDELKHDKDEGRDLSRVVADFNEFVKVLISSPVNKIEAKVLDDDSMRLGAFATSDIRKDEVYLSVPSEWILSVDIIIQTIEHSGDSDSNVVGLTSSFRHILKKYYEGEKDDFLVLLLFLMYERFVAQSDSKWWPYLNVLPTLDEMEDNVPLFFSEHDINHHLSGSDLRKMILNHQRKVDEKFNFLLSDHHITSNDFLGRAFTYNNFRWAHAILDSRSIWWNRNRHLVPLLDMVNCNEFSNDGLGGDKIDDNHKVHSTTLDKSGENAETKSQKDVRGGEQLFENYGQPNHVYFLYHGFILKNNIYDCAILNGIVLSARDEGARDIERSRGRLSSIGVHTFSPTFCIKNGDSLHQVADFLRVKHNLDTSDDGKGVNSLAIRNRVKDVLESRLLRYDNNDVGAMNMDQLSVANMVKIVHDEKAHFSKALNDLMSIEFVNST